MDIIETEARDFAAEHLLYIARIEPIIRRRLTGRGVEQARIDAFIADLPVKHFSVQIRRSIAAMQLPAQVAARLILS